MNKVYVVFSTTGEWSDRTESMVVAYSSKSKAEELVRTLQDLYRTFSSNYGYRRDEGEAKELQTSMEKYYNNFYEDSTGTFWYVEECPYAE